MERTFPLDPFALTPDELWVVIKEVAQVDPLARAVVDLHRFRSIPREKAALGLAVAALQSKMDAGTRLSEAMAHQPPPPISINLADGEWMPGIPLAGVEVAWLKLSVPFEGAREDWVELAVLEGDSWFTAGDWRGESAKEMCDGVIVCWKPYRIPKP